MPTTTQHRARLGDLLLAHGVVTAEQLAAAVDIQKHGQQNKLLGEILVGLGYATEEQVLSAVAESCGVPFAHLAAELVDPAVRGSLPEAFIEKHTVLPLFRVRDVLTVAMAEPANVFLIEEVAHVAGMNVQTVAATGANILQMVRETRDGAVDGAEGADAVGEFRAADSLLQPEDYESTYGSRSPEKVALLLVREAWRTRASAIHLEPDEKVLRIRFRIDGVLHVVMRPPARMTTALTDAFIDLVDLPARGPAAPHLRQSARLTVDGHTVQIQLASMRGVFGPRTVLSLVRDDEAVRPLDKLGCDFGLLASYRQMIEDRWGLVLVAGPRESGVTSTLYSTLRDLDPIRLNICTLEASVGYPLSGINQFSPGTCGQAGAAALGGLALQRPDVLMFDGILDAEAAAAAADAAADRQLVLCQVGATDAAEAIVRMRQWIPGPALASVLRGVMAQRLVRTVCPQCKTLYEPSAAQRRRFGAWFGPVGNLSKGRGCPACRLTGFLGRMGLFEFVPVEAGLADPIRLGADAGSLRHAARAAGCRSLWGDGFDKIKAGITSLDEVLGVLAGYPLPAAEEEPALARARA